MTANAEKFDRCIKVTPPLDAVQLSELPAARGVVLLSTSDGAAVTLLPAANMRSRVGVRLASVADDKLRKTADLRQTVGQICWKSLPTAMACDLAFIDLAAEFWPGGGEYLKTLRAPWCVTLEGRKDRSVLAARRWSAGSGDFSLGPIPTRKSAEKLIAVLGDAFGLCRDYTRLAAAPSGRRCAYGQMGKCLCPCDGGIDMESYNAAVASAAGKFSVGVASAMAETESQMKRAASQLRFEDAARLKLSRERIGELSCRDFDFLCDLSTFGVLAIQRVPLRKRVQIFYCRNGQVGGGTVLTASAGDDAIAKVLADANESSIVAADPAIAAWRMALMCRYMWSDRGGVFLKQSGLDVATVRQAMEKLLSAAGEKEQANAESAIEACSNPPEMEL